MKNTRIALVQMNAQLGKISENLKKTELFVKQAAAQQADIICFPELSVPGYARAGSGSYAEEIPGPTGHRLAQLAQQHNITILAGIAEKSAAGNKPFISQLVAMPDGTVDKYRKTHLGKSEQAYFSAGDQLPVFKTDKATFGVQICWDLHFPEITTIMSLNGAEIIFAPHASPRIAGNRREMWLKYLTARAYDNTVYVAACNLIGFNGDSTDFSGGTLVIDPKGNVIAEDFNDQEGLLIADLDAQLVNEIRYQKRTGMKHIFYLRSRRPELYQDLLK